MKIVFNVIEANVTRSYGFKLETQHGDVLFSAMTSQIRSSWISALRSQIPRRTSSASSTTSFTSAWPYTKQPLSVDDEDLVPVDVAEMMERRAKKRELRSKSLVYPQRDRKDRDRRLTDINQTTPIITDIRMQSDTELIKSLQNEVMSLKQRIDISCNCSNKNCEQDILKLKNRNSDLSDEIDDSHKQVSSLNNSLANSQEQLKKERNMADHVSKVHQQQLEILNDNNQQLKLELDDACDKIDDLICSNVHLNDDHHMLLDQLEQQKDDIYDYDRKLNENVKELEEASKLLDTLNEDITFDREQFQRERIEFQQNRSTLTLENEKLSEHLDCEKQKFKILDEKLNFVRREFEVNSDKQLTTSADIIDSLNKRIDELTETIQCEKNAFDTADNRMKSMSSIEMDYEVKLGEISAKLVDANKKIDNMDRRKNRNQRYSQNLDETTSLKDRIATLEQQRIDSPIARNSRLYEIATNSSYDCIDHVQADLSEYVQEQCTTVDDCVRRSIAEQLTREALVLRKLSSVNFESNESDSYVVKTGIETLSRAYHHLSQCDLDECKTFDALSTFLSSKLFLIERLSDHDSLELKSSLVTPALLSTYTTRNRSTVNSLFSTIEGFCYFACSVLSEFGADFERDIEAKVQQLGGDAVDPAIVAKFTCSGRLNDAKLYDYFVTLLACNIVLRLETIPPSTSFLVDCSLTREQFVQRLDECSVVELDEACRNYEEGSLLENVRVQYQMSVTESRIKNLVENNEITKEKLEHSESIIEKLDLEIKRLWYLVDQNTKENGENDEISKLKEMYESEIVHIENQLKSNICEMKSEHENALNDKMILFEEESIATQDAISSLKQQHLIEISHFKDIIHDLQSIDVDCIDKRLQDENDLLQSELTKTENQLLNSDNECIALKERISQQLVDLHTSRKRVQDLIQRNDELNSKLSIDIQDLLEIIEDRKKVQITGSLEVITIELKLKGEKIWQLKEDLVSRSNELQETIIELETSIEMFQELHKKHNEMQDRLNNEIQQLRIQLYLKPPSSDEGTSSEDETHSLTSNMSPVCRKQQWRKDKEEDSRERSK